MKTKNLTPFVVGARVTSRRPPIPEMTLVVRARFILEPGKPLTLPEGPTLVAQGPMRAEVFADGDDERAGECLYPGDFADYKPKADVLLRGTCYTPDQKALAECPVRFSVGKWSKILRVVGRRAWSDARASAAMSAPIPFTECAMDYAHAFGGPGFLANPIGKGIEGNELANIEHTRGIVRSRADRPEPAGFGPINPAWPTRASKMGKEYGPSYEEKRAPWYAEDFDWAYFQAAPTDQQIEGYLTGNEEVRFENLHPRAPVLETTLPGLRIRAFVHDDTSRFREVPMVLDTLFADLDEGSLFLTWRGLDVVRESDMLDIRTLLVASEKLEEAPLDPAHYHAKLLAFEKDPLELEERLSPEMLGAFKRLQADRGADKKKDGANPAAAFEASLDLLGTPRAESAKGPMNALFANATKSSKPHVDLGAALSGASKTASARPPAPGIRLAHGGPPPAWIGAAIDKAKASIARAKAQSLKDTPEIDLEALDAFEKHPMFARPANDRPPEEPGPYRNLSGQDLSGRDLRGVDLSGANLEWALLTGANFRGAKLTRANLYGAVANGAHFDGADLSGANLTLANLTDAIAIEANLTDAKLDRAFFEKADLTGAVLLRAHGDNVFMPGAILRGANGRSLRLHKAFGQGAVLAGAQLSEAELTRCLFLDLDAEKVILEKALLTRTSFARSTLESARLNGSRGERTVWLGAHLKSADLERAVLHHAFFMNACLDGASFRGADLREARCYRASMVRTDFERANLFGADLTKCKVDDARFVKANLYDAKLIEASGARSDFSGANLKRARLARA